MVASIALGCGGKECFWSRARKKPSPLRPGGGFFIVLARTGDRQRSASRHRAAGVRGTERSESWGALHNTLTTDCGGTAILRRSPPTERASRDTPTSAQSYRRFCFFRFGLSRSHSSPYRTIARLCGTRQFSVSGRIVCTRPARCHACAPSSQGATHSCG